MVRYERPSLATRCCLPLVNGMRRPFKPKIIRLLLANLFWLLSFIWMVVCGNISTIRSPKDQAALPDILFDVFPRKGVYHLPEVFLYALLTSAIGRMIFHKDGVAIARRFATIAGCIYLIRGLTLIATSMPAANKDQCATYYTTAGSLWTNVSVVLTDSCSDSMGHTVNVVLAALAWGQYTNIRIVQVLAWLTSITAMILFIVNRSHYTIDILFSLFISIFCWKYYHMALRLPPNCQNVVLQWMEKLDGVTVGDVEREREMSMRDGLSISTVVNEALGTPIAGPSKVYKELKEENVA